MKKSKLLTSIAALALVVCLGACESGDIYIDMGGVDIGGSSSDTTDTETSEPDESSSSTGTTPDDDPSVNNPTTTYDYSITYEGNGYVFAYTLPKGANEGDSVYFKLLTESGYSIDSVAASYIDAAQKNVSIALSGDGAAGYTFTMPAADVAIKASAVGAYFKLTYDTETPIFVDLDDNYYDATDFIDGFYQPGTDTKIGEGSGLYFQAGSEILVVAKHVATADNLRVYANGEKLELVEDEDLNAGFYAYLLKMPAKDCKLTFDEVDLKYVNISIQGNDYVDAYLYTDSNDDSKATRLERVDVNSTNYYIHAEMKDEYYSQYDIGNVTISWTEFSTQTSAKTEEKSATTDWASRDRTTDDANFGFIDNDTKVGLVPDALFASDELTISFELANAGQYKGQLFVGNWTGYEFYNENKYGSLVNTVIDGNGNMTSSTNNLTNVIVSSITSEGYAVLSDNRTFYTDGKIAYLLFSSSTSTCSDVWVLAKDVENITLDFYAPSGSMHVIRVFDESGNYISALYANEADEAGVKYYVGVTIDFLDGTTSLSETGATFAVKDTNGNILYSREAIYRESNFVGTWVGYEFKNQSKTGNLVNTTLAATGDVSGSVSYLNDLTIESVNDNGCPVLSDGRTFYTDGNVALILCSSYSSSGGADVYILAKGVDDISFDFYAVSNTNYIMRVLDENGTYLGALYVDDADSASFKYYAGVSIEFTDGSTSLAEAGSTFIVTDASGNELYSRQPKYTDYPFVGTWAPSNFYSGSSHSVVSTFTIDVMGDITGNSTFSSYSVSSVSDDGYDVVLTNGSSSKTFYTNGNVGIMYYSGSCNDSWVCAKGYDTFTQDYWASSNYLWLDILKDSTTGEVIGALFADSSLSPDIYAGVIIDYTSQGDTLAASSFTVKDRNGNLLYTKS